MLVVLSAAMLTALSATMISQATPVFADKKSVKTTTATTVTTPETSM
jgi:hypothetical protein